MKLKGIRKRWMTTSMLIVLAVVIVAIVAFAMIISSYFYSGVSSSLESLADTSTDFFNNYITSSYSEYYQSAYRFTETFEQRDKLELQFINTSGSILISTYGVTAGISPGTEDLTRALETGETAVWSGYDPNTGEHIMSVSSPLIFADDQIIGVMRYVTSLKAVSYTHLDVYKRQPLSRSSRPG